MRTIRTGSIGETDARGRLIWHVLNDLELSVINDGRPTHISGSAIDLTITSPDITSELQWDVEDSVLSSDHFPTITAIVTEIELEPEVRNWKKAHWEDFRKDEAWKRLEIINCRDPAEGIEELYSIFNELKERHVPKNKIRRYFPKIWWTQESREAWKERERLYRKYKNTNALSDKIQWKRSRAITTRTFRSARQESRKEYVETLREGTRTTEVWKIINKIRGRNIREINILKHNNEIYSNYKGIAEILADSFASVCSEENYNPIFRQYKRKVESRKIEFESPNDEPYNAPFTLQELELAIETNKKRTAPGPFEVHNMIRNVPEQARLHMLTILY